MLLVKMLKFSIDSNASTVLSLISRFLTALFVLIVFLFAATRTHASFHNRVSSFSELIDVFNFVPLRVNDSQLITVQRANVQQGRQKRDAGGNQQNQKRRRIRFNAWNSTYVIELEPSHSLLSPRLTTVFRDGEKVETFRGLPGNLSTHYNCHYNGRVISHGGIPASISDCDGHLRGIFQHEDHFLVIESMREKANGGESEKHIIFKYRRPFHSKSWGQKPLELHNANFEEKLMKEGRFPKNDRRDFATAKKVEEKESTPSKVMHQMKRQDRLRIPKINKNQYTVSNIKALEQYYTFPLTLELGIFVDWTLYEHFRQKFTTVSNKTLDEQIIDFVLTFVNNVHVLYQYLTPRLNIAIVRLDIWKTKPIQFSKEPERPDDAEFLLGEFCEIQTGLNLGTDLTEPGHWDHAVRLTAIEMIAYDEEGKKAGVAGGIAAWKAMCIKDASCSAINAKDFGGSFAMAHELGHSLGMTHDAQHNPCELGCCLMSPTSGPMEEKPWSNCSVIEFYHFLLKHLDAEPGRNCLRDPAENAAAFDHFKDVRLPGQRISAHEQCAYQFGPQYVHRPKHDDYSGVCRILRCTDGIGSISGNPPLEGTWCGGENWCRGGSCQPWSNDLEPRMPAPKRVDGDWASEWISLDKECTKNPITGSLSVISQFLPCNDPYPNNGGRECKGASRRALICRGSSKEGSPLKDYGDGICTIHRNDPNNPTREELTGLSVLDKELPCVILCELRHSRLRPSKIDPIQFAGLYPNGTPCGKGDYCLEGVCSFEACDGKALFQKDKEGDCPTKKEMSIIPR